MSTKLQEDFLSGYFRSLSKLFLAVSLEDVGNVVSVLEKARMDRRMIFVLGNGGSAATAAHFATDLGKGTVEEGRPRFRVVALTENAPLITAWANDTDYMDVFAQQLQSLVQPEDVVIAFSGSGRSPNVLRAVETAHSMGAWTVGFCGFDGGLLKNVVDVSVHVPSNRMDHVEDAHHTLQHAICAILREVGTGEGQ